VDGIGIGYDALCDAMISSPLGRIYRQPGREAVIALMNLLRDAVRFCS